MFPCHSSILSQLEVGEWSLKINLKANIGIYCKQSWSLKINLKAIIGIYCKQSCKHLKEIIGKNKLGLSCAKLRSCSKLAFPADLCKEWFQVDILFVCDFKPRLTRCLSISVNLEQVLFCYFCTNKFWLALVVFVGWMEGGGGFQKNILSFVPIRVTWNKFIFSPKN